MLGLWLAYLGPMLGLCWVNVGFFLIFWVPHVGVMFNSFGRYIWYTAWNPVKPCWDYVKPRGAMLPLYMLEELEACCAGLKSFEDNPALINTLADNHYFLKTPEFYSQPGLFFGTGLTLSKLPIQKGCKNAAKRLQARPGTNCTNLSTA